MSTVSAQVCVRFTRPEITQALRNIEATESIRNQDVAFHLAASLAMGYSPSSACARHDAIDYRAENNLRFVHALLALQ